MLISEAQAILGGPSVPRDQLDSIIAKSNPHLPVAQRDDLAAAYSVYGVLTTIGNVLPLLQFAVETGWGTSLRWTASRNPAGLGATDDGAWGSTFASVADGVAAQYAHLLCYASLPEHLPVQLRAFSYLSPRRDALKAAYGLGCCPSWQQLAGKWATDVNYWTKIRRRWSA